MTTTAEKYTKAISRKGKSVAVEVRRVRNMSITRVAKPLVQLDPPQPIRDAKGSLTNVELRKLAEKHQPPSSWHEGEEEQLF